jgi:hypothetical protein
MSELSYAGATIIQTNPSGTLNVVQKSYIANLAIPERLNGTSVPFSLTANAFRGLQLSQGQTPALLWHS